MTPGIHERSSKWSPDGKWIAYISDASGTDEIYLRPQDGAGAAQQLTKDGDTYKYGFLWSPNGRKLLWSDKKLRLLYVDVQTKEVVEVDKAERWEFNDFAWSPDSRWIAYSRPELEPMNRIYLYSVETKKKAAVTDGWYESDSPAFSSDGKYLLFISSRDFNPVFSQVEYNHAYLAMSRIYLLTLAKETKSPFEPKSDEVAVKKEEPPAKADKPGAKAADKKDEKKDAAPPVVTVKVDLDGLQDRIIGLPIEVADYRSVAGIGDAIYYLKRGLRDTVTQFKMYSLADLKETDLGAVDGYEISADLKKMLAGKGSDYAIIDLPKAPVKFDEKLDLSGLEVLVDPRREWDQIYEECWRQMKDFFYAPNMHGVDWDALRLRYRPLAQAVQHRADLTYVIGELIGELNSGHTYVGGGEPTGIRGCVPRLPRSASTLRKGIGSWRSTDFRRTAWPTSTKRCTTKPASRFGSRSTPGPRRRGAATSRSCPSRPRTTSITRAGSRATSGKWTRLRAVVWATFISRTWVWAGSTSSSVGFILSSVKRP
jgi:tricorn protease